MGRPIGISRRPTPTSCALNKKSTMERRIRRIRATEEVTEDEQGGDDIMLYDGGTVEDDPDILVFGNRRFLPHLKRAH